jgi:NAD(P)-dependent dehydrogenase (short-subunit alcohol dehydrogenase family)
VTRPGAAALVTGASSGIGRAVAIALGHEGAAAFLVGRDPETLSEVASAIRWGGARAETLAADLTDGDAPERAVAAAADAFGGLDYLVNAAGSIDTGTVETTDDPAWERMMAINVTVPFRLIRAAAPHLAERHGAVVNVSSVTGLRAFPGVLAYCVSKAALDQLTRCAALELAPRGVRVNSVNPGVVVTNLHRRAGMNEEQYQAFLERSRETHPLGRPGTPQEIADLIMFLLSDRAGWITGETVSIDGGRQLTCAR